MKPTPLASKGDEHSLLRERSLCVPYFQACLLLRCLFSPDAEAVYISPFLPYNSFYLVLSFSFSQSSDWEDSASFSPPGHLSFHLELIVFSVGNLSSWTDFPLCSWLSLSSITPASVAAAAFSDWKNISVFAFKMSSLHLSQQLDSHRFVPSHPRMQTEQMANAGQSKHSSWGTASLARHSLGGSLTGVALSCRCFASIGQAGCISATARTSEEVAKQGKVWGKGARWKGWGAVTTHWLCFVFSPPSCSFTMAQSKLFVLAHNVSPSLTSPLLCTLITLCFAWVFQGLLFITLEIIIWLGQSKSFCESA